MPYAVRHPSSTSFYGNAIPKGVKWLLISNIGVFVLHFFAMEFGFGDFFLDFSLWPRAVLGAFAVWQLVTYLFLHGGFSHILFNMFALWMFGADLERDWGTRWFLEFYFLCGIGAGLCVVAASVVFGGLDVPTIGSSGAIYGLLMAFGVLYPDRIVLFSFLFPIKAKHFVMIIGALAFMSSFAGSSSNVSHVAHLGGMIFGYFFLMRSRRAARPLVGLGRSFSRHYHSWKMQRAKRKFEVYVKKQDSDRDRWVH